MKTGACLKCGIEQVMANLIVTPSGITVCPEDRYARDVYAIAHQTLAPAPVEISSAPSLADELVGGQVIDLPTRRRRLRSPHTRRSA